MSGEERALCGLFHVDRFPIPEESAREIVGLRPLDRIAEHLRELVTVQQERRVVALTSGSTTTITVASVLDGDVAGLFDASVFPAHVKPGMTYESTAGLVQGFPISPGSGLLGLRFTPMDRTNMEPGRYRNNVAASAVSVFDILRSSWAAVDQPGPLGLGAGTDPRAIPHWLNFFGPDREHEARALADQFGVELERRPWGGFVVQCWEDPFDPPVQDVATRAGSSRGEHVFANLASLVAGCRVEEPPGSLGRLSVFEAVDGACVVGLPVLSLETGHAFAESLSVDDALAALEEAERELARLGLEGEPGLFVVWQEVA